jgi:hypothetical protein
MYPGHRVVQKRTAWQPVFLPGCRNSGLFPPGTAFASGVTYGVTILILNVYSDWTEWIGSANGQGSA